MVDNVKVQDESLNLEETKQEEGDIPTPEDTTQPVPEKTDEHATASIDAPEEKAPIADFSTYENQVKMYEQTMETVKPGNIVEGTIIRVDSSEVLVDIGFKAEGVIPLSEFKNAADVQIGNAVWVYIVREESASGRPILSKFRADVHRKWKELKQKFDEDAVLTGHISKRVKGGLIVDFDGINAFLPASQVSVKNLPNMDHLVGKEDQFKIINFDREKENVVVSRKIVMEEQISKRKEELLKSIDQNQEIDGIVKNIMDYGVFVDLGGIDGLLHISDMSWGHIGHPSEMLNIGDKIKVKVLSFDKEKERVSLGLKQLVPHPWENIEVKYPEGSKVDGKVTNITNYGAFVELEKGVEGLVHVSEMSWTKQINHPKQIVKVGDTVSAIVLQVDKEEHRISLGMKQCDPNPWLAIDVRHPEDSVVTGKIKNITNFGAFMEVEPDIDGLIHISDMSWTKRVMHPSEMLKKGQVVTAKVLSVDKVMQRIALGIKQLEEDPWENVEEDFSVNSEHRVRVVKIIPKGLLAATENGIEGFIPSSHLAIPGLSQNDMVFEVGEELPVKVIETDRENRRLIMSVKTYFFGREDDEQKEYIANHQEKKLRLEAAQKAAREAAEAAEAAKKAALNKEEKVEEETPVSTAEESTPVEEPSKADDAQPESDNADVKE